MTKILRMLLTGMIAALLLFPAGGGTAVAKTFKVGYLEGGPYWTYDGTFNAIKTALNRPELWVDIGWDGKAEYPEDARKSPGWDNPEQLKKDAAELMSRTDLDLIISAGTSATKELLAANNGKTPIVAMAVADAVKSKFVTSETDSGLDNFTVRIVPGRYKRMFQIFHDVVGFKKLGLLYPDTESGRKYANVEDAQEVAKERGFELVEYRKVSKSETVDECMIGLNELEKQGIDAFFIPTLLCFDWEQNDVKPLMDHLIEKKIPTFARDGTKVVKSGALMGFSTYDFSKRGQFLAERVVRILKGESARKLSMVDNAIPKISLNLQVAELIGFDPSFDIIAASDEIFQDITTPDSAGDN